MCNKFKTKKDVVFLCFALGFSNRNLTEIYTELELKSSKSRKLIYMCPLTLVTPREGPLELGRGDNAPQRSETREKATFHLSLTVLQIVVTESQALNFV